MQLIPPGSTVGEARYAATIGFFDGVHTGHRFLLEQVKAEAAKRGLSGMAITFSEHPRAVLKADYQPNLLTGEEEKTRLLASTGIDALLMLDFTRKFAAQTAEEFIGRLAEDYGVRCLVIGHDHRFGSNRNDGFEEYKAYGATCGIEVVAAEALKNADFIVSSSAIRRLLGEGLAEQAARALGRSYALEGSIIGGKRIGRELGFPTANLQAAEKRQLIPKEGVYAGYATVEGCTYPAMVNIGRRPTLDADGHQSIEAHLFGFSGDLYGKTMRIEFTNRLRDEKKFISLEALQAQLRKDAEATLNILKV